MYIATTIIVISDEYRHDSVSQNLKPFDILHFLMFCMQSSSVLFKQTKPVGSDLTGSTSKHGPATSVMKWVIANVCMYVHTTHLTHIFPKTEKIGGLNFNVSIS